MSAYTEARVINKLWTKIVFSAAPELDLGAKDMGEGMVSLSVEESVKRLPTATGTTASLEIFVPVTANVKIAKQSPSINAWFERWKSNGFIGGSVVLYDDSNNSYTARNPSIAIGEIGDINGTQADITFTIKADLEVNLTALAGF